MFQTYPDFVRSSPTTECFDGPECNAYRLDSAPNISVDALTADGQYAPRKIKTNETIELTGINFRAKISTDERNSLSSLGVVNEQEFAQCNVIENFLRVYTAHGALRQGGAILHSAGLVLDDKAYIFVGRSNSGKTTLTRKAYRNGVRILSDDINLVLPGTGGYRAFPVPFTGEFGRTVSQPGGRMSYQVAGIVLLQQGERLETRRVRESEAVARLLVGCPFVNTGTDESSALFEVLSDIVGKVPVLNLSSRRQDTIEDIMEAVHRDIDHA